MTRKFKYTLAGLFLAPAFALAQAPVIALKATDDPTKAPVVRGQAPVSPMTPAVPAKLPPATTTPATPATPPPAGMTPVPAPAPSAVPAPAMALPEPGKACEGCQPEEEAKPEEKFLLQKLLESSCAGKTLADNGWKVYGWTQGSYTAGTAARSNLPVPFIDRAREFSLNQNWIHVEKAVDTSKKEFQWGFGADGIVPGTDARFTYARGLFDRQNANGVLYGFDLFQAYVDLFAPNIGPQGTTFRLGKFATFLEYETVQAISTPFISRSYLFQYNPFTHTGGLAITPLNDDWTISNGIVMGNDNFFDPTARVTYIGQLKWAPKDGNSTLAFGTSITNPQFNVPEAFPNYNVYNLQLTHKLCDKLQYVFDGSVSHMSNVPGVGNADWYGMVHYLFHDTTDKIQNKLRVELFNDTQGVRTGTAGLYTAVTYGVTYKPTPWLWVMPEVRYDHSNSGNGPFEGKNNLFTVAIGGILRW